MRVRTILIPMALILYASTGAAEAPAVIAQGSYPDLALANDGVMHLVYVRDGVLFHRQRDGGGWSGEQTTGLSSGLVSRSDPEVVVDSTGRPHVLVGSGYAYRDGGQWISIDPGVYRDTALAIDSQDNVYVCLRGGHQGGYLGVRRRAAGSSSFTALPDPDIAGGLPLGRNDHVYGHLFVSPSDDSIHVVYRHGAPTNFAYRASDDGGQTWYGGGVSGDDSEAPSGTGAADGTIVVVGGAGTVYRRTGTPSQWESLGRAVSSVGRDLPALAVGPSGELYVTSFGGRYNTYQTTWTGEALLPSLSGSSLGFAEVVAAGPGQAYVVWEEGDSVDNDGIAGTSDIVFASLGADGSVGGGGGDPGSEPDPPTGVDVR